MRRQGADLVGQIDRRPRPVDTAVVVAELLGVDSARPPAAARRPSRRRHAVERRHEARDRGRSQQRVGLAGVGRPAARGRGAGRRHRPSSTPALIAIVVTPSSVSPASSARSTGAAPRQRGTADGWTTSPGRRLQQARRNDAPVGTGDEDVGLEREQRILDIGLAQRVGLQERHGGLLQRSLHRRRLRCAVTTAGLVGRRQPDGDLVRRAEQPLEDGDRERRGAGEGDLQGRSAARVTRRGPVTRALVAQLAQRPAALFTRRALEDQDAVEVIELVLDHARLELVGVVLDGAPAASRPLTRTLAGRSTGTLTPGTLRHPSSTISRLVDEKSIAPGLTSADRSRRRRRRSPGERRRSGAPRDRRRGRRP